MTAQKPVQKCVHVTLSPQDYARLSQLAEESARTRPGYLRWLLHGHLRKTDSPCPPSNPPKH